MFGAISQATNSSFLKGMTFCRSIYIVGEKSYEATCIHI